MIVTGNESFTATFTGSRTGNVARGAVASTATPAARLTALADEGGSAEEPAWSADGSTVYFKGTVSGEEGVLAKVSAKGGAVSPAFGTEYDVHGRHPRLHGG